MCHSFAVMINYPCNRNISIFKILDSRGSKFIWFSTCFFSTSCLAILMFAGLSLLSYIDDVKYRSSMFSFKSQVYSTLIDCNCLIKEDWYLNRPSGSLRHESYFENDKVDRIFIESKNMNKMLYEFDYIILHLL